ncbi:MAG TPA: glycosyltransferase, partial [Solirubrobacteraceae bacterium]|nr:glycosyltransferase [Solirubrobacteraceae bacterium]
MLLRRTLKLVAALYLVVLIVSVMAYKAAFINLMFHNVFFGVYSVCVAGYILSRFLFSLFYRSSPDAGLEPRIAIVMPGYNEQEAIGQSLSSLLELDYPIEKLQLIAVNDGSSDRTLQEMQRVAADCQGRVSVINFPQNRGKRAAMA